MTGWNHKWPGWNDLGETANGLGEMTWVKPQKPRVKPQKPRVKPQNTRVICGFQNWRFYCGFGGGVADPPPKPQNTRAICGFSYAAGHLKPEKEPSIVVLLDLQVAKNRKTPGCFVVLGGCQPHTPKTGKEMLCGIISVWIFWRKRRRNKRRNECVSFRSHFFAWHRPLNGNLLQSAEQIKEMNTFASVANFFFALRVREKNTTKSCVLAVSKKRCKKVKCFLRAAPTEKRYNKKRFTQKGVQQTKKLPWRCALKTKYDKKEKEVQRSKKIS